MVEPEHHSNEQLNQALNNLSIEQATWNEIKDPSRENSFKYACEKLGLPYLSPERPNVESHLTVRTIKENMLVLEQGDKVIGRYIISKAGSGPLAPPSILAQLIKERILNQILKGEEPIKGFDPEQDFWHIRELPDEIEEIVTRQESERLVVENIEEEVIRKPKTTVYILADELPDNIEHYIYQRNMRTFTTIYAIRKLKRSYEEVEIIPIRYSSNSSRTSLEGLLERSSNQLRKFPHPDSAYEEIFLDAQNKNFREEQLGDINIIHYSDGEGKSNTNAMMDRVFNLIDKYPNAIVNFFQFSQYNPNIPGITTLVDHLSEYLRLKRSKLRRGMEKYSSKINILDFTNMKMLEVLKIFF